MCSECSVPGPDGLLPRLCSPDLRTVNWWQSTGVLHDAALYENNNNCYSKQEIMLLLINLVYQNQGGGPSEEVIIIVTCAYQYQLLCAL